MNQIKVGKTTFRVDSLRGINQKEAIKKFPKVNEEIVKQAHKLAKEAPKETEKETEKE